MKNKFKMILIGLVPLFFALTFPVKINAAKTSYSPTSAKVTDTQSVYTLPPQPACESPKGTGQDRQPLGYILRPGGSITITNNSDIGFTVQLLNNNSAATIGKRVLAHSTVTIKAPNPPLPQTTKAGKVVKDNANDVDLVPFILTPRTNKTTDKVSCNVTVKGPHTKLPIFSYTNDNQSTFMNQWKQSGGYALIQGKRFQILLPADAQSYVEHMDKAPMGYNAKDQPNPVPQGQKYVCRNLMDVLHFYDDVLYPTYDKIAGLSPNASEPYNKLVPGKYFYTADLKGAGGANYSPARTEFCGADDAQCWLQPNWALFHETGHGYQIHEMGGAALGQHVVEVSNNILGNYMYYYILFNGNTKGADEYSWNYIGFKSDKEAMETSVHDILVNNNWSWDQILPHNGGRGKHVGLILLQNMVEKMTYAGWTQVFEMDRQQVYEAEQKKDSDMNSHLMNLWDLITKAASDHGYDYTAIMNEIGKTPQLPLSQEARQKQDKAVNFLWYLMPKASYSQVYSVVQELAKADPSLVYDSNFTLVTPDETKALNLNGKLNLTIYDMPLSWAGKTISIMDGNQVYGILTIGPDGKFSLNNVPLGTYTLAGLPDSSHTLTNYYVTVTDDPAYMNSTDVIPHSESSSTSSTTSSSKQSSTASSSLKSSSSSKVSSSSVKSSSLIKSSSLKSSSLKSSSVIKSSSIKSSSSVKSSSVKSSAKSSSEVSSKKSSMIKSTSKASSKKASSKKSSPIKGSAKSSSEISSKKSSMIKSTSKASSKKASSKESSSVKSSAKSLSEISSKKSSMIKSSNKASSKSISSKESSSLKSSAKSSSEVSSKKSSMIKSSMKSATAKSHRGGNRPVKSSLTQSSSKSASSENSSVIVSRKVSTESSSQVAVSSKANVSSESVQRHSNPVKSESSSNVSSALTGQTANAPAATVASKSSTAKNVTTQKAPAGQITADPNATKGTTVMSSKVVNVSSVENVPVTVSSTKEVPVPVKNGSSVESSMVKQNVPVTSMTSTIVNHQSEVAVPVKSELPATTKASSAVVKPVQQGTQNPGASQPAAGRQAVPAAVNNGQERTNQPTNNSYPTASSKAPISSAHQNSSRKANENRLPQTGEAATTAVVIAGIVMAGLGYALLKKLDD